MTPGYRRFVKGLAGPDHSCRQSHASQIELLAHLGQHFPPPHQRLMQQAMARVIEQIEHSVLHRTLVSRLADAARVIQTVPA
jgi:hypothetical protein